MSDTTVPRKSINRASHIANRLPAILASLLLTTLSIKAWPDHPLGTNLTGITGWSSQRPFTNLFKQSRPWFTQCSPELEPDCESSWDTQDANKLRLDSDGWVMSLPEISEPGFSIAATVLHLPKGMYQVRYEGSGSITYGLDADLIDSNRENGVDAVHIKKTEGKLLLQIRETDPKGVGDYIRNIQVLSSQYSDLDTYPTFEASFLNQVRPYQAIRFMDWMATNGNEAKTWQDRLRPETATYSQQDKKLGVPIEIMVELANELDISPWFTIPHQADDKYVREFAQLVQQNMTSPKKIYIEYSNEVWNQAFPQHHWVAKEASALWPKSKVAETSKVANWYGKRTAEVCSIWKTVFEQNRQQISCVMGSQASNTWIAEQALKCPLWKQNTKISCASHEINALAIAPYFGGYLGRTDRTKVLNWIESRDPLNQLFSELKNAALPLSESWIQKNHNLAEKFDIALFAYEAGQHLVGTRGFENNEAATDLFITANRDDRMGTTYLDYYKIWFKNGGGLAINFTLIEEASKWGSWGVLEHQGQLSSPKHNALMQLIAGASQQEVLVKQSPINAYNSDATWD